MCDKQVGFRVLMVSGVVLLFLLVGCDFTNEASDSLGSYTVEYYFQDIGSSTYSLHDSEEHEGVIGSTVSVEPKRYPGFTEDTDHEDRVLRGLITADGSLTLQIFYDRNTYTLNFMANGGIGAMDSMTLETGQKITLPDNGYTMDEHHFIGWSLFEPGSIAYGDGDEFTMDVSDATLFANWLQNCIIIGRVGTYAPISGASVEFFSPDGELLGSAVTAGDGSYRWDTKVACDSYDVVVAGGSLLGSTFNGVLRGTAQSDTCNLTPMSTLVCTLAERLETTCDAAGQQLSAWLDIPEDEDPFVDMLLEEDVTYADVDALTYALRALDGGVSVWIDKVISAFESESEPNAMWIEPLQTDAQTIWSNALDRNRGDVVKIDMDITVTRPSSTKKIYEAVYHRQSTDRLNQDVYVWFANPVEVRNSGYLFNMVDGNHDTNIYVSAFDKTREIVLDDYIALFGSQGPSDDAYCFSQGEEDSGMYTYEDVQFPFVGTYTPKYALETECLGHDAYVIRLEKDDGNTAYASIDVVILKDSSLIVDRKMYAKESPLVMVKHVHASGLEEVEGILTPKTITMDNPHTDSSTKLEFQNISYDVEFDAGTFTTSNLEK